MKWQNHSSVKSAVSILHLLGMFVAVSPSYAGALIGFGPDGLA